MKVTHLRVIGGSLGGRKAAVATRARQTIGRNVRFGWEQAPWRTLVVLNTSRILVPRPWERNSASIKRTPSVCGGRPEKREPIMPLAAIYLAVAAGTWF